MTKHQEECQNKVKPIENFFKIIVVEDDEGLNLLIRKRLKKEGFRLDWAENGKVALAKITGDADEVLLLDYKLPDMTGKELIEKLVANFKKVPYFITMTGFGDERIAVQMMKLGARDYIVKEADFIDVLVEKLKRTCSVIDKHRKLKETELALKESELSYRTLYESMAQGVVYQNEKGEIISANHAAEKILGLSYSQMIGATSMDPRWKAVDGSKKELPGKKHPAMLALTTGKPVENFLQGIYNPQKKDYVWIIVNSIPQFKQDASKPFQVFSTFLDITHRIQSEEQIHRQSKMLRETGQMAKVGGWEFKLKNNTVIFSEITKNIHEVPADFIPTLDEALNFYPSESRSIIEKAVQNAIEKGISFNLEVPFVTAKGRRIWVHAIGKPEMKLGICLRLQGTFQDINDRKQNEQHLLELNSQLSLAQNIAKLGYWTFNLKTQKPIWTDECFTMYGIPKQQGEPDYHDHKKYIHPDDWDLFDYSVQKLITDDVPYDIQLRLVRNNGNIVWIRSKGFSRKNNKGEITELYGIIHDITEFKNTEKQLIDQKLLFETMFNTIDDAIVLTDTSRKITLANNGLKKTFGYNPEDVIGEFTKIFYADETNYSEKGQHYYSESAKAKMNLYITNYKDKQNNVFPGETFGAKLLNANGEWIGNLGIMRNVTERLNYIKNLKKAKEKAEEADRLKSAFLTNMSHEIRTPMNGILGFTSLLREPEISSEEQQEFIEIIQQSGNRMLNTVNDLIDISKIETGQMEVSLAEFSITEVLESQFHFFKPEAEQKGIKFTLINLVPGNNNLITTDLHKFDSILTNLIKNAIKFTDKGFIKLGCIKKDRHIECFIKDSGIGIPLNRQQAIFDRFVQADIGDSRAFQGSGLGLSISKAYVEMLGGKLWLESETGIGSTFYFTIPLQNTVSKKIDDVSKVPGNHTTTLDDKPIILIAEDDEVSFQHLSIILKNTAGEIIHAKTGIEAVDFCRNNPNIDMVLMDIKMPLLNGYDATRKIRAFNKDVIIIAQTAYALVGDRSESIKAGCNDYVTKPIIAGNLLKLIKSYLKKQ